MHWSAVLLAFIVAHLTGDLLLQTEFQALNKAGGLGRHSRARRALLAHGATYTLAYVPVLVWLATEHTLLAVVGAAVLVAVPHVLVDDGRFVRIWLREVKHAEEPALGLVAAVDQTFHVLCLLGVALLMAT